MEQGKADPNQFYLFERYDDLRSTVYFYLDKPVNELPVIESFDKRIAGLTD